MKVYLLWQVSKELKNKVSEALFKEFRTDFENNSLNSSQEVLSELEKQYLSVVFCDDSMEFKGFVCIKIDTPTVTYNTTYWICNLFVEESSRGQGIGSQILEFIEDDLYKTGISVLHLWCNEPLLDYYMKKRWYLHSQDAGKNIMIKMLSLHNGSDYKWAIEENITQHHVFNPEIRFEAMEEEIKALNKKYDEIIRILSEIRNP